MTDSDSPIIDFYPEDFDIDMNGKKMAWQGVALLPFIEQDRLLSAIRSKQDQLTDDEKRRNSHGVNVMVIMDENPLYQQFCKLYTKKRPTQVSGTVPLVQASMLTCLPVQPIEIDGKLSFGVFGSVLPDPTCIPGSTLDTPIPGIEACPDLYDNRAISVQYWFPKQLKPHKSILLPGARPPRPILDDYDKEKVRSSTGNGGSRRRGGYGGGGGYHNNGYNSPGMGTPNSRGSPYSTPSYSPAPGRGGFGGRGRGDYGTPSRGGYNNNGGGRGGYNAGGYSAGGMGGAAAYNSFAGAPPRPAYAPPSNLYGAGSYGAPNPGAGYGYQGGLGGSGSYAPPANTFNPYGGNVAPVNPYGAPAMPYAGAGAGSGYGSRGGRGASSNRGGNYGGYGYGNRGR